MVSVGSESNQGVYQHFSSIEGATVAHSSGETWNLGSGALAVRPAEFAGIDDACDEFLRAITRIRALAVGIGDHTQWGLGEGNARLISAATLVTRLRCLAGAPENSVVTALDAHSRIVEDIRRILRDARDRIVQADEEWGFQLSSVESTAGQSLPSPSVSA
ncbi:hypothetical protein [Nocardia sp. NPDC058705]|uniref:hypothetical protein n=1 Tax=Nocardia sp. NPDC058705 TaxID=3346609 RepID=UPI0036A689E0